MEWIAVIHICKCELTLATFFRVFEGALRHFSEMNAACNIFPEFLRGACNIIPGFHALTVTFSEKAKAVLY